jgi:hypothetical protein
MGTARELLIVTNSRCYYSLRVSLTAEMPHALLKNIRINALEYKSVRGRKRNWQRQNDKQRAWIRDLRLRKAEVGHGSLSTGLLRPFEIRFHFFSSMVYWRQ